MWDTACLWFGEPVCAADAEETNSVVDTWHDIGKQPTDRWLKTPTSERRVCHQLNILHESVSGFVVRESLCWRTHLRHVFINYSRIRYCLWGRDFHIFEIQTCRATRTHIERVVFLRKILQMQNMELTWSHDELVLMRLNERKKKQIPQQHQAEFHGLIQDLRLLCFSGRQWLSLGLW